MSYKTKAEAEKAAKRDCPRGWKIRVWENIGWHVSYENGPLSIHEFGFGSKMEWSCQIATTIKDSGHGMANLPDCEFGKTPLLAAINAAKVLRQYYADEMKRLGDLVAYCDKVGV